MPDADWFATLSLLTNPPQCSVEVHLVVGSQSYCRKGSSFAATRNKGQRTCMIPQAQQLMPRAQQQGNFNGLCIELFTLESMKNDEKHDETLCMVVGRHVVFFRRRRIISPVLAGCHREIRRAARTFNPSANGTSTALVFRFAASFEQCRSTVSGAGTNARPCRHQGRAGNDQAYLDDVSRSRPRLAGA